MKPYLLLAAGALTLSACSITVADRSVPVRPVAVIEAQPGGVASVSLGYSRVRVSPDRGQGANYFVGESVRFGVFVPENGYLSLLSLDPDGRSNYLVRNVPVRAGTTVFPRAGDNVSFDLIPPRGVQRVQAIFTPQPLTLQLGVTYSSYAGWQTAITGQLGGRNAEVTETFFYIR